MILIIRNFIIYAKRVFLLGFGVYVVTLVIISSSYLPTPKFPLGYSISIEVGSVELQLMSRLQGSVPLENMAASEGGFRWPHIPAQPSPHTLFFPRSSPKYSGISQPGFGSPRGHQ